MSPSLKLTGNAQFFPTLTLKVPAVTASIPIATGLLPGTPFFIVFGWLSDKIGRKPIAARLVELFPTRIRYSGLSLPYHNGNGWFGGFLPATLFAIVAAMPRNSVRGVFLGKAGIRRL